MKLVSRMFFSVLVFVCCMGCGGGLDPKTVTEKFWDTMKTEDKEAAKLYLTKASGEKINQNKNKKSFDPEKQSIVVGEASIQSDQSKASVNTTLTMKDDKREVQFQFNTILVQEEGSWKVDYDLTTTEMRSGMMKSMTGGGMNVTVDPKTGKQTIQFDGTGMSPEEFEKWKANKEKIEADVQAKQPVIEEMKRKMEELKKKQEQQKKERESKE